MKIIFILLILVAFAQNHKNIRQVSILSLDGFQLAMIHQESILQLQLENINTRDIFDIKITQQSLENDEELNHYFAETKEIFEYFDKHLHLLSISKFGWIQFTVPALNKAKQPTIKIIRLISKQKIDKKQQNTLIVGDSDLNLYLQAETLILKIQNTVTLDSFKLKLTPTLIKQDKILSIFQKPSQLLKYLKNIQDYLSISEEGLLSFAIKIRQKQSKITIKTNKIKILQKDLLAKILKIHQNTQREMKQKWKLIQEKLELCLQKKEQTPKTSKFQIDSNNWHNYLFDKYMNRLRKKDGDGVWQAIFGKQLSPKSNFTFKVKQVNTKNDRIMYGVGSNRIRGKDNSHTQTGDCCLYHSGSSGFLYPHGISLDTGGVRNGEIIEIIIDTENWQVIWNKNGFQLATMSINKKIRDQPLFPVIFMVSVGDQIQFV